MHHKIFILRAEQRHGEISRQHLGEHRGYKRLGPGGSQGLHGLKGTHVHGFNQLEQLLAHIGKGKHRNRAGARHGAQAENVGGDQGADQRRQRPNQAEEQAHEKHDRPVRHNIAGREDREGDGQNRTDKGAQEGHLDRIQQRRPNLGEIAGVRREHRVENIKKPTAAADQRFEVKPGDANRYDRTEQNHQQNQRQSCKFLLHNFAVGQLIAARLKETVIQLHAVSSRGADSP